MKTSTILLLLFTFLVFVMTKAYDVNEDKSSTCSFHQQSCSRPFPINETFECSIYLAPSSIPNAGFGLFTTRSIASDKKLQEYSEAPSVVVTDFYEPAGNEEGDWNHVDYIWEPTGYSAFEAEEASMSVMTFGSLCNYHPVSAIYFTIIL